MRDPIAPARARHPAEAVEIVCVAISDGDLDAALAQYERAAVLQPWRKMPGQPATIQAMLAQLAELRLPVSVRICAVLSAGGLALVLGERRIAGATPDCRAVDYRGLGATVVRRQPGDRWLIAADAWRLAGADGGPQA